jgi:hypothetical protein
MNFPFKNIRATLSPGARKSGRLTAVWVRDPRTGRLVQTWRDADDGERSCTGRPGGPPFLRIAGGALRRAA